MRTTALLALGGCLLAAPASAQCQFGWELQNTQSGPTGRSGHAMAFDSARGATVLFGGVDGHDRGDTWEWNSDEWRQIDVTGPSPRRDHAMAYDSARRVTVLFGGAAPGPKDDTWEYDGVAWRQVASGGPWARSRHCLAYDSARGVTVMFGGVNPSDTWEWDGAVWRPFAGALPPPTLDAAMAYDSRRGVTVLFGGSTSTTYDTAVWEFDGAAWVRREIAGPGGRARHAIAFDDRRGLTVLFGGNDSPETWAYTGSSWFQLMTPGPSARRDHAMAFDSVWGRAVLFGGLADPRLDDTWELGPGEPPAIIEGPVGAMVGTDATVEMTVEVSGDLETWFRWRRDGIALVDGPAPDGAVISGSTTGVLRLDGVRWADEGDYDVVVSTICGAAAAGPANLTVICPIDFTGDKLIDFADYLAFLTFYTLQDPRADLNGDGQVEFPDYLVFLNRYESGC